MTDNEKSKETVGRREVIKGAAATGLIAAAGAHRIANSAENYTAGRDSILRENAETGTRDWMLTKTRQIPGMINKHLANGRCQEIEGYCSANSVRAGETLKIMVSANPESNFKLEIFRTGYYGGLGARLMKTFESLKAGT